MSYQTHIFDDNLGGRFYYRDVPGRLEQLLALDAKPYRKPRAPQGEINVKAQAEWYVGQVLAHQKKELLFYPLQSNMQSYSNRFQYVVLKGLVQKYTHRPSQYDELLALRENAIAEGYTLTEYREEADEI
jgi:hypothetical protein